MTTRAVIVMGVSGSGKSTLGAALAARLGWTFADADDYHPAANTAKMARGQALTDDDRAPWLAALHALLVGSVEQNTPLVLACSALKERYRRALIGELDGVQIVFARGSHDLIAARMRARQHFMPVSLLDSQLALLEEPSGALVADIARPVEELVEVLTAQLVNDPASPAAP